MARRPAAQILLIAVEEIGRLLSEAAESLRDGTTACDPWTVRDVLAHCSGSMLRVVENRGHRFTPEDNEIDVVERRSWPFDQVRDELQMTAQPTAARIDAVGGALDGLGLGVWVHSGDIREALGLADPYAAPGFELGIGLLEERSRRKEFSLDVHLGERAITFGSGPVAGDLVTDIETFVRLAGGRSPDPARFRLTGAEPPDLVLFG
ncbi:MAG: maleylpyruvate isomerase family mycothiol-dependent enzyme [Acidimicrobiia bacterium]|nr:maleylpyruvate isomerase family mycothiol-dependent enzyme [Acidimicrobiia bacterium]